MKPKIIAEVGINANGDVEVAQAMMLMAKQCGADMVKFQKRTIEIVYTPELLAQPRESPFGTTQREQKEGLEFGIEEYHIINHYSQVIGLPWFASAWDLESLRFLDIFDLPCNKIASAMLTYRDFVEEVAKRKKLTYVSTGMTDNLDAIITVVNVFRYHECPLVLMHCVGDYPQRTEDSNLKMIATYKRMFPDIPIGYSCHHVSPIIAALAAYEDVAAIEKHITLDRSMYGSDQSASLEQEGLKKLVDYCMMADLARGDGVKRMTETERVNAKKLRWWEK